MNLTPKDLAEIEYERAEEKCNEQKYICDSLRTAIEDIQYYLDWSEARDTIVEELERELEGSEKMLLRYKVTLVVAENDLSRFGD